MGTKASTHSFPSTWRMSAINHPLRRNRWLRIIAALVLIVWAFHFIDSTRRYRQTLLDKYSPTTYTRQTTQQDIQLTSAPWQWHGEDADDLPRRGSYSRRDLLAKRAEWTRLGAGFEGEVFVYRDVVIKKFKTNNAPFRNCVPGVHPEIRWPTEISASIMLGGMAQNDTLRDGATYLPVVDYFLAPSNGRDPFMWHFVTPFLPSGNLKKLSKELRDSKTSYTARDLDVVFRPSFEKLLDVLGVMHADKNLCHDDIGPNNIFLGAPASIEGKPGGPEATTHWLLADLGNVREPGHPYHSSILWSSLNQNLPDCRANDAYRLVKSYTLFLRDSVDDRANFDEELLSDAQPWSQLLWATRHDAEQHRPISAASVKERSAQLHPTNKTRNAALHAHQAAGLWHPFLRSVMRRDWMVTQGVMETLKINAGEKVARRWGLVPLLGLPVGKCAVQV